MTNNNYYEEIVRKHRDRVNLYAMSVAALAIALIGIALPPLMVYAQQQEPVVEQDQFTKLEGILYAGLTIVGFALTIISAFLRKYGLGSGATATAMLNFSQKTVENIGDITLLARTMNTFSGGKLQEELDKNGARIDLFDEKLKVGIEQMEVLKPLVLKYLGEKVDPNKKQLPREFEKTVRVFPEAEARETGGEKIKT